MPRTKLNQQKKLKSLSHRSTDLIQQLVTHLQSEEMLCGQPLIYEREMNEAVVRVIVIWDKWLACSLEQRTEIILAAYEKIPETPNIALASGLTIPEAIIAGYLSFQIIPVVRKEDEIEKAECLSLMKSFGASTLVDSDKPLLFFATEEEAAKMIQLLIREEPKSKDVWTILSRQELSHDDVAEDVMPSSEFGSFSEGFIYIW